MKRIYKICISLLLLTIMAFNGGNWNAYARDVLPPPDEIPNVRVNLDTTKTIIEQGDTL